MKIQSSKTNKNCRLLLAEQRLYPHLKITGEKFPRLLVTRKIEADGAEYFGAFLPETGVRLFLDFLNKVFRLRSCTIEIDGSFPVPCPQFYSKRCVAPCVESLCDEKEYAETVEFLRLFLQNKRKDLEERFLAKIKFFAEATDFENASKWRDRLLTIQDFWRKNEWILWLDDAIDSWEIEEKDERVFVYLVTTRGRKTLGKRVFVFETAESFSAAEILETVLTQFYRFHALAEIRVPLDFPSRKILAEDLSKREARKIKISVVNETNQKKTAQRAIRRNKFEFDLKNVKPPVLTEQLQSEIKRIFNLKKIPNRLEAFDAAHISGTNAVAACVVWENGRFIADQYKFWLFDETSELKALEKSINSRFSGAQTVPDLLLIDGGSSQLNAALKASESLAGRNFLIISAVKPPQQHSEISHFLTETNERISFEIDSESFRLLQRVRDEAHNFANSVHRTRRDFSHFYELAAVLPSIDEKTRRMLLQKFGSINKLKEASRADLIEIFDGEIAEIIWKDLQNYKTGGARQIEPLIVPIRFDDPNGDAQDLQPIQSFR